jgi:cytochrome c oxidase subunit 2
MVPTRRLVPFAAVAALAAALAGAASSAEPVPVVEITARRFEFKPAEITLEAGKPVVLRLVSQDVTHGFYMKDLGLDATIVPSGPTDVPLTPRTPGRYTVICDHFCGSGHGGMKMTIVVR